MKTFIILCCFVVIIIATPTTLELHSKWNEFKSTHGKTYENPIEEKKRLEIFADNVKKIEEHNQLYEQGLTTYKMAVNQFTDWIHEEFVAYLTKQNRVQHEALFTFQQPLNVNLPKEVDWRKYGIVTPVKNQGPCGACWAFSATGSMEGQNALRTRKLISLSEQELIDCSKENAACNGGALESAFDYVKKYGLTTEEYYPFKGNQTQCKSGYMPVAVRTRGYVDIPSKNELALLSAVATVGPISVAVDATYWSAYASGIYNGQCNNTINSLNHGVLVVGYTEDYWIIKNSWGSTWGENGYIRLPRYQNACGIAMAATYPLIG